MEKAEDHVNHISQVFNQSFSLLENQSICQSVLLYYEQSCYYPISKLVNQLISQSVNQSISQSVISQSVNQSISQSDSQLL